MKRIIENSSRALLLGCSLVTLSACSQHDKEALSNLTLIPEVIEHPDTGESPQIEMPQVETGPDNQKFIRFSFPTPNHGMQTALLDTYAPYDYREGSFQWRGKVEGQSNSKAVLTQYKNRVYITIEAGPAGAYEIRGDAREMLEVLELNRPAYTNFEKSGHHGAMQNDAATHPQ